MTSGPMPLEAVTVNGYVPPLPAAGVPLTVPVPSPLSVKVTPGGSCPAGTLRFGFGKPDVVTMIEPGIPAVRFSLLKSFSVGASFTVSAKV